MNQLDELSQQQQQEKYHDFNGTYQIRLCPKNITVSIGHVKFDYVLKVDKQMVKIPFSFVQFGLHWLKANVI